MGRIRGPIRLSLPPADFEQMWVDQTQPYAFACA